MLLVSLKRGTVLRLFSSASLALLVSLVAADADAQTPRWERLAPVPEARTEVSVTTDGRRIFVLAGFTAPPSGTIRNGEVPVTRDILIYDPATNSWEDGGQMPVATHHTGFVRVGDRSYLVGGYEGSGFGPRTDGVWIYDPATGDWREGSPMPTPRGGLALSVLDGKIHAIGGTVANPDLLDRSEHTVSELDGSVGTHEVYDPATDSWERLAPMPTPRNHHIAGTVDGRILVTGGRILGAGGRATANMGITVTEVYDPATDSWSEGPPLPTGRSGSAGALLDGRFYVFGGEASDGTGRTFIVDVAERFDPARNAWERLPPMPSARHGFGAVVVDGRIYAVSGGPTPAYSFATANERLILP
jgi:N-acetylneuraminic acid mutarotase